MRKKSISHISSVGIIFREANPAEIFLEMKDDGHPIKLARRQLCLIGGNWIGQEAKDDRSTLDTFKRELQEELSFDRPIRDSLELKLLGQSKLEHFLPTPSSGKRATAKDRENLDRLKKVICQSAIPFGDFINTVEKRALDRADPANRREGFTYLCSYWAVGLKEDAWQNLLWLQDKFKNLSNESLSVITSLEKIIETGAKTAFCHDRVLKRFFLKQKLEAAQNLPLVPNLQSLETGRPLPSYADYLKRYQVARWPV